MIAIEVFRKKKIMAPVLDRCWQPITGTIVYPEVGSQQPEQKLAYFGMVAYTIVYESAASAGMSSSAAHYLARLQLGKCSLGAAVTGVVESTFSGSEKEDDRANAELFRGKIGRMIAEIMAGEGDIGSLQRQLAAGYRPVEGLSPSRCGGQ